MSHTLGEQMARRLPSRPPKVKFSVAMDHALYKWLTGIAADIHKPVSQIVEYAVRELQSQDETRDAPADDHVF